MRAPPCSAVGSSHPRWVIERTRWISRMCRLAGWLLPLVISSHLLHCCVSSLPSRPIRLWRGSAVVQVAARLMDEGNRRGRSACDKEPILTAASSPRPELSHMALTEGDGCAAQGMDGRMEEGETDRGGEGLTEQGTTCPLVLSADLLTSLPFPPRLRPFSLGRAKEQRCEAT